MAQASTTKIAVAVVESAGAFLIGLRPSGAPLAGYWEFPGGKVQPHESPAEAARRECFEETGLEVQVVNEYLACTHRYEHGVLELHFFRCTPTGGVASPRGSFRWVPRDELGKFRFPEANTELLSQLCGPNSF